MQTSNFLGWTITFKDETNDIEYQSEIVNLKIGLDVSSCVVMCTISYSVDSSFLKYFLKEHTGTLTLINKMIYTDEAQEMFIIKLTSVTNVGAAMHREEDQSQSNITLIPIQYMCSEGIKLMNARVGGIYHDKTLKQIVQDLYDQAKVDLPLKLEDPSNSNQYKNIMLKESSFIEAIRYLNQQYGLYDNKFLMFGDTFSDSSFNWVINCINKIKREEIKLILTNYEHKAHGTSESIDRRIYYTYMPLNIKNNFIKTKRQMPQVTKFIAFDDDKFVKREDVAFAGTLREMNFLSANKQFDEQMDMKQKLYVGSNFVQKDYALKNAIQSVGLSTLQIPSVTIPNPFKLAHFKIGTPINYQSQSMGFADADIKLIILGWVLTIQQGDGVNGGATYKTTMKVRAAATSYLGNE